MAGARYHPDRVEARAGALFTRCSLREREPPGRPIRPPDRRRDSLLAVGPVVVETFREWDGALLVATARGGGDVERSSAPPFAFERGAEGRFVASLRDRDGESSIAVAVAGGSVHVQWVGALETIVFRDHAVLHRTVSRPPSIGAPAREPGVDVAGPWPAEPGDLVLLCSANVHRVLSEADVTMLASREDLATIVRGVVTTTSTRGELVEICAVAIRIGGR